jgi:brefeldin A-resistance guanine nucleotide exchange factor 1
MLTQLLIKSNPGEKTAMEETRTRAATLLGKVFLQHLTPLASLPTFTLLWKTILDFMEKFMKAASSDLLADAVPESLKNMLLVMDTAGIFYTQGRTTPLWNLTWDTLESFLPALMSEVFGTRERVHPPVDPPAAVSAAVPAAVPASPLPSPVDPPVLPASTFEPVQAETAFSFEPPSEVAPPVASKPVVVLPKMPEFAPLPPPPLDLPPLEGAPAPTSAAGFQPIAMANPTGAFVALANPKAIPAPNPQLSSYFPGSSPPDASRPQLGNVLTAAFTPTMANNSSTVILNSPVGEQSPASADNH